MYQNDICFIQEKLELPYIYEDEKPVNLIISIYGNFVWNSKDIKWRSACNNNRQFINYLIPDRFLFATICIDIFLLNICLYARGSIWTFIKANLYFSVCTIQDWWWCVGLLYVMIDVISLSLRNEKYYTKWQCSC